MRGSRGQIRLAKVEEPKGWPAARGAIKQRQCAGAHLKGNETKRLRRVELGSTSGLCCASTQRSSARAATGANNKGQTPRRQFAKLMSFANPFL